MGVVGGGGCFPAFPSSSPYWVKQPPPLSSLSRAFSCSPSGFSPSLFPPSLLVPGGFPSFPGNTHTHTGRRLGPTCGTLLGGTMQVLLLLLLLDGFAPDACYQSVDGGREWHRVRLFPVLVLCG